MHSNKLICDILDYIDNNINKEITIDELANLFFFNRYYVIKLFKKELGITIVNYLNSIRIYNSLKEYKYNNHIMWIAFNNGFNSLEYYSETFKKIMQVSPRTYQNFVKRRKYSTSDLEKIIQSITDLQILRDYVDRYKSHRPVDKVKTKTLSIFKK